MPNPNFMVMEFRDDYGQGNPCSIVGSQIDFPKGKEQFVDFAKEFYEDRKYINKLKTENVKESYCRYSGIHSCYMLTTKNTRGSFPVWYIDV